jgi:hypothetical protein
MPPSIRCGRRRQPIGCRGTLPQVLWIIRKPPASVNHFLPAPAVRPIDVSSCHFVPPAQCKVHSAAKTACFQRSPVICRSSARHQRRENRHSAAWNSPAMISRNGAKPLKGIEPEIHRIASLPYLLPHCVSASLRATSHASTLVVNTRAECAAASPSSAPPNRAISAGVRKKPVWN